MGPPRSRIGVSEEVALPTAPSWLGRAPGAIVALVLASGAAAGDDLTRIVASFAENRERLREYEWKSETELEIDGERQDARLDDVQYDSEGELRRTPANDERSSASRSRRKPGKKQRQQEELLESLRGLIEAYVQPDPRTARRLYAEATVWQGDARDEGLTRVQARNVLRQGDEVSLWLDSVTRLPRRLRIVTSFGGEPVLASTEFEILAGGPFYASQVVVETEVGEKKLVFTTRNFDFRARAG